ncbi:hypothetical protein LCGC14_2397810, partial [marine sediment metagenome]
VSFQYWNEARGGSGTNKYWAYIGYDNSPSPNWDTVKGLFSMENEELVNNQSYNSLATAGALDWKDYTFEAKVKRLVVTDRHLYVSMTTEKTIGSGN